MRPQLRAAYDDHDEISDATSLVCSDPSLAQQHQKDETDINLIVRKYVQTGELPTHNLPPLQEEFAQVTSIQEAMDRVIEAEHAFMQQPAEVRSRFDNDPSKFVEFCSNTENIKDMKKMGLLNQDATDRLDLEEAREREIAARDKRDAEAFRNEQKAPKS